MRMPTASDSLNESIKKAGRTFDDAERIKLSLEISEVLTYLMNNKELADEMLRSGEFRPSDSDIAWDTRNNQWKAYARGKSIVIYSMDENGVLANEASATMKFPAFFEVERAIARDKRNSENPPV